MSGQLYAPARRFVEPDGRQRSLVLRSVGSCRVWRHGIAGHVVAADPHPVFRVPGSCQEKLQRPISERLPYRAHVLVERDLQGGVPDAVPLQVPSVVLLPQPRTILQRFLHHDWHRLHLDAARSQRGGPHIAEG